MAMPGPLLVLTQVLQSQLGIVSGPTHPTQARTGELAHCGDSYVSHPAANDAHVLNKTVARMLQEQQREKPVGVQLTAKLYIHISEITIHTIQHRLGESDFDLNPAAKRPLS